MKKIDRHGKLPAGIVLSGGGAKLPLITDLAKKSFDLPVFLGLPVEKDFPIDKLNDLEYTTALGLVIWADKNMPSGGKGMAGLKIFGNSTGKAMRWVKSLWPSG